MAQRVGRLLYIYYCSAKELNYGYLTPATVFSFEIVLGSPN